MGAVEVSRVHLNAEGGKVKKRKDWKTTLPGFLTGGAYLFLQALSGGVKVRDAALATGLAILGKVAADGGGSDATPTK